MLELRGVHVGYGRTAVVHGVDVEVPDGSVVAVMGHNGAGKTTLLRAAVGLLPVRSGTVLLGGEDVTRRRPHQRVRAGLAYVPQGQQSFGQLTARENLQLVADVAGSAGGRRLDEALDLFPALRELLGRRAGLLSGGQRQQLAIARALITGPRLIVLDEPTEGIQPSVVAEIEDAIVQLAGDGLSVLLVEQHVGFALAASSRYYVLESGRVTAEGVGGVAQEGDVRAAMAI
ncbi:urea ABC transporter ATP-binding subunit UrtE [Cellulomonas xiejunii]|uniref:Urea ABC transporter ATP-binding subunit UrtE n=1 Tax=Cellulomonas xiejunii TaxID=2968083 RepID=A0ABY5KTS3_9CELL|nr:urea ABC transporter ATP-binding subunit UrtE [Cellulomonas xiejunii]MCC2313800.1 urea ABC transporter ATP-binding subunit UrtE [Cellulomonas xiejunii]MCC2322555.1 urea ABC transporter ATP-binding subunit UrtE [Cellulomonas xiejunii]UUI72591.1 urea ABC transporter ATP-binding subunit UrtE [Cellulomonas xiejunii]